MSTEYVLQYDVYPGFSILLYYNYTPETPDVMYLPNGDPGYPGEAAELEVTHAYMRIGEAMHDLVPDIDEHALDALVKYIEANHQEDF